MSVIVENDFNKNDIVYFVDGSYAQILDVLKPVEVFTRDRDTVIKTIYNISYNGRNLYASNNALQKRDPSIFSPVIFNIGYRGDIDYWIYKNIYGKWKDMIYRCYNPNSTLYNWYGAVGVTVDPRWFCFEIFIYDILNINNFSEMFNEPNKYELDIQTKQKHVADYDRIYTPGKTVIKKYMSSDVFDAINEKRMSGEPNHIKKHIAEQIMNAPPATPVKKNTPSSYISVINNPPKLEIPSIDDTGINIVRTFNGIVKTNKSPIKPVRRGKIMCRIVEKYDTDN